MIGQTIGHYKVLDKLGEGGMGVVYLAEDTTLDRKVALKVLPADLARSPERLGRFQREAKMLAALDHPNIVAIHSVEEEGDVRFLTMQFIEGQSLSELIPQGGMTVDRILEIAIPLVEALAVAHEKGVIHRDLKPANIMVTREGQAKLMDFGVAKLSSDLAMPDATQQPTEAWGLTGSGAVMGTIAYMSPEQVRGEALDARSDLFSLGMVLYEMVTGRKAFSGETTGIVFDAILNREPQPPAELRPDISPNLSQIILKALEKDRDIRYQTARDLLADLKRLRRDTTSGRRAAMTGTATAAVPAATVPNAPMATGQTKDRRRWLVLAGILVVVIALGALVLRLISSPTAPSLEDIVQITSYRSMKNRPLTDGTRLYFISGETGINTVLNQVAVSGGNTDTIPVPLPAPVLVDISPDGTELLVLADREMTGTTVDVQPLWIVPVLGGTPRPIGGLKAIDAAWSPDGRTVAYTVRAELFLAAIDGSNPRQIWEADGEAWYPVWAPDGQRLRLSIVNSENDFSSIWEVGADGNDPHPMLPDFDVSACCGRWSPDGRLYYFEAGGSDPTDTLSMPPETDIWVLPEKTSWLSSERPQPVRLTQGPLGYGRPVSSPDGLKVFVRGWKQAGEVVTCRVPEGECSPFLGGIDGEGVSFSRDGQWVAWVAPDGALWRGRVDGSERLQLTFPPLRAALPQWSPDGQRIAFAQLAGPRTGILLLPATGGQPQPAVPEPPGTLMDVSWSPDGRRLALGHRLSLDPEDRDLNLGIADLETGQLTPVPGSKGLFSPRWSPDGRFLAALSHDSLRLLLFDFSSQQWRTLVDDGTVNSYPVWTQDSRYLYFSGSGGGRFRLRIADSHKEVVHSLAGLQQLSRDLGTWAGQAPDGSVLTVRDTSLDEIFALELAAPK